MKLCQISIITLLLFHLISLRATEISGYVSGVWEETGNPYNINSDITIPDGETLLIKAGVKVVFKGEYLFNVQGRLLTQGANNEKMITMTADNTWRGLRFVNIDEKNEVSILKNTKITNGSATGSNLNKYGGAIYINPKSKLIISGCELVGNQAILKGGAIYAESDYPLLIENTIIKNNKAKATNSLGADGGGIYFANGSKATLINNAISGNIAESGQYGGHGGGICFYMSTVKQTGNLIAKNTADNGGGIFSYASNTQSENLTIADNKATVQGGGISCYQSNDSFLNTIVAGNTTSNGNSLQIFESNVPNSNPDQQPLQLNYCMVEGSYYSNSSNVTNEVFGSNNFKGTGIHPYQLKHSSNAINAGKFDSDDDYSISTKDSKAITSLTNLTNYTFKVYINDLEYEVTLASDPSDQATTVTALNDAIAASLPDSPRLENMLQAKNGTAANTVVIASNAASTSTLGQGFSLARGSQGADVLTVLELDPGNYYSTPAEDLAGNPRIYDGTDTPDKIDLGAYEYQNNPMGAGPIFDDFAAHVTSSEELVLNADLLDNSSFQIILNGTNPPLPISFGDLTLTDINSVVAAVNTALTTAGIHNTIDAVQGVGNRVTLQFDPVNYPDYDVSGKHFQVMVPTNGTNALTILKLQAGTYVNANEDIDKDGASVKEGYEIFLGAHATDIDAVSDPNQAPKYKIVSVDPPLPNYANNMVINEISGLFSWKTTSFDAGEYTVGICAYSGDPEVSEGTNAYQDTVQTIKLTVNEDPGGAGHDDNTFSLNPPTGDVYCTELETINFSVTNESNLPYAFEWWAKKKSETNYDSVATGANYTFSGSQGLGRYDVRLKIKEGQDARSTVENKDWDVTVIPAGWEPENTGINHQIIIPASIVTGAAGHLASHDLVGAFYTADIEGETVQKCAGYIEVLEGAGNNVALTIWGNNGNSTAKNGYDAGETMVFKTWHFDESTGENWFYDLDASQGAGHGYVDQSSQAYLNSDDNKFKVNGVSQFDGNFILTKRVNYDLQIRSGWSIVSLPTLPPIAAERNLNELLKTISSKIVIIKNYQGDIFFPAEDGNLNQIGNWDPKQAYRICTSDSVVLKVNGHDLLNSGDPSAAATTPAATIDYMTAEGWYLIPYPRHTEDAIGNVLVTNNSGSLANSDFGVVKDWEGKVYTTNPAVDQIGNLKTGEGYQIQILNNNGHTIVFNQNSVAKEDFTIKDLVENSFNPKSDRKGIKKQRGFKNTDNNATIIIPNSAIEGRLNNGDELAVYSKTHALFVGCGVYQNNTTGITIWGDDTYTDEVDGLEPGEEYVIQVNLDANGVPEKEFYNISFAQGSNSYQPDAINIIEAIGSIGAPTDIAENLPKVTKLYQNYPNPFNPSTTIKFDLSKSSQVVLEVYNYKGEKISTLINGKMEAGAYNIKWNGKDSHHNLVSAGVYYIKMKADNYSKIKRAVLIK